MIYYVNISTEEMMDIILSNTAHSMFFKKVDIDVMRNHDAEHQLIFDDQPAYDKAKDRVADL